MQGIFRQGSVSVRVYTDDGTADFEVPAFISWTPTSDPVAVALSYAADAHRRRVERDDEAASG